MSIIRPIRPVGHLQPKELPLFLASVSPRRREILRTLGLGFRALKPDWPEPAPRIGNPPTRYAIANARGKVRSVLGRVESGIVIGMDTIVVLKSRILGKPETGAEARAMLSSLSGRTHSVITGLALAVKPSDTGKTRLLCDSEQSLVTFRKLGKEDVCRYVASGEPFDKAGAYAIQGRAGRFVTEVSGSYTNVIGLPALKLLKLLARQESAQGVVFLTNRWKSLSRFSNLLSSMK